MIPRKKWESDWHQTSNQLYLVTEQNGTMASKFWEESTDRDVDIDVDIDTAKKKKNKRIYTIIIRETSLDKDW